MPNQGGFQSSGAVARARLHTSHRYTWPMPAVSVIATVLNESRRIPRLVPTLLALDPPAAEIVIVDGGSKDGTWEWLVAEAEKYPSLRPIRDESCNIKRSAGPISRGRNVAIAASTSELIACADAGCTYAPDWLARLTGPLVEGKAEYALGGSCLDLEDATIWDLASAPYFGVKLTPDVPSKSCTARSMAFTKSLWQRVGGFPESAFFGEDTLFDQQVRSVTPPFFVQCAKASYRPQYSFRFACRQFGGYSKSDGILGVRPARLTRNAARCFVEVAALAALPWTWIPLALVMVMILHFAYSPDRLVVLKRRPKVLAARLIFSVLVPWLIAINHVRGRFSKKHPMNAKNSH